MVKLGLESKSVAIRNLKNILAARGQQAFQIGLYSTPN